MWSVVPQREHVTRRATRVPCSLRGPPTKRALVSGPFLRALPLALALAVFLATAARPGRAAATMGAGLSRRTRFFSVGMAPERSSRADVGNEGCANGGRNDADV